MAIFPLIADKDSAAITLSAVSGNELPGSGLAPYDAYELQVSVNGVASGTDAPAYTATLKSKGVPVGLVMKIELTSLNADSNDVAAESLAISWYNSAGTQVTKTMGAEDDVIYVIHLGKEVFESYNAGDRRVLLGVDDTVTAP